MALKKVHHVISLITSATLVKQKWRVRSSCWALAVPLGYTKERSLALGCTDQGPKCLGGHDAELNVAPSNRDFTMGPLHESCTLNEAE